MKKGLLLVACVLSAHILSAAQWKGFSDASYYSGPKITEADLQGKVVLVDLWGVNCPPCRAMLPQIEKIWQSFKSKPFYVIGAHSQGRKEAEVKELVKKNKLTYPIYDFAGLVGAPSSNGLPFLYVVNHRGRVVYSGRDEKAATEAIVNALGVLSTGVSSLVGDVSLKHYKSLEKQLVLGKSIKSHIKKLEGDIKKANGKMANAQAKAKADEAEQILRAIDTAKKDAKDEIQALMTSNPAKAIKLIGDFAKTFPDDGATFKEKIPELKEKAAEMKAAEKAKAKAKK